MRAFFPFIIHKFNVSEAVIRGRESLKHNGLNTFYQYIHLTQCTGETEIKEIKAEIPPLRDQQRILYNSLNHPSEDNIYIPRFSVISDIENGYLTGAKAILLTGLGGMGKTSLSAIMEKRLLNHYDARLKREKSVWLDLREDPTPGGIIAQLCGILRGIGDYSAAQELNDRREMDPLEICRILMKSLGDKIFLTLDNCEDVLDSSSQFQDEKMKIFLLTLISQTPGWKVLITARESFDLTLDHRTLFHFRNINLGTMGFTEQTAHLNLHLEQKGKGLSLSDEEKRKILREMGENPYELVWFFGEITGQSDIENLIKEIHGKTGEYAKINFYLGKLKQEEIRFLQFLSVFRDPPSLEKVKLVIENMDDFNYCDTERILEHLVKRGFVEKREECFTIPRFVVYYLHNIENPFLLESEKREKFGKAISLIFYNIYQALHNKLQDLISDEKEKGINELQILHLGFLISALRQSFAQSDCIMQILLLSEANENAKGIIPILEILDYAEMSGKNIRALSIDKEKEKIIGTLFHRIGMVYQEQRIWDMALENYKNAIEWKKKTGQLNELGSSYHQIGTVYLLQRIWDMALENYNNAIEWTMKTSQFHELGRSYHQIGRVYEEQSEWNKSGLSYLKSLEIYHHYDPENPEAKVVFSSLFRLIQTMKNKGIDLPPELKTFEDTLPK